MFDHLTGLQVLVVLAPIVAIMHVIRWREQHLGETSYKHLNGAQKIWVLTNLLPPGLAAELLGHMNDQEVRACLEAGRSIRGNGRNLMEPTLKEFLGMLPPALRRSEAELLDKVGFAVQQSPSQALELIRDHWAPATAAAEG